jgi:hypothetical protein
MHCGQFAARRGKVANPPSCRWSGKSERFPKGARLLCYLPVAARMARPRSGATGAESLRGRAAAGLVAAAKRPAATQATAHVDQSAAAPRARATARACDKPAPIAVTRCGCALQPPPTLKTSALLRASRDPQGKARLRSRAFSICANCAEITSPRGLCRTDSRTACRSPWQGRHRARRALWPPRRSPRRQSWRNRSALRSPFRATSPR